MRFCKFLPRPPRLAFGLALLAVLAQLWMVQLSTHHMAQMLWQQVLWGEVCTVGDSPHRAVPPASEGEPSAQMSNLANCPVCFAAALGPALGSTHTAPAATHDSTPYRIRLATAPAHALRHANLRPPAQAPPRA